MRYIIILYALLVLSFNGICQESNSLNNISISNIFLPKEDDNYFTLALLKDIGTYNYKYNYLKINVLYYSKEKILDLSPYSKSNIEYFKLIEQYNSGLINKMPNIIWHQNNRFNILNGYKYLDTFIFLTDEFSDTQLTRMLYLTVNNYYIRIRISIYPDNDYERMILFDKIYEEAPQYFIIFSDKSIIFREGKNEKVIWNNENNGKLKFGNDLLDGKNNSQTANSWFSKTEEFLSKIQYK